METAFGEVFSTAIPTSELILIKAVCLERHRQLRLLLDAGVNVNCQDRKTGCTPLIQAMFVENPKQRLVIVKLLLRHRGELAKCDTQGRSALAWACFLARNEVLAYIFNHKYIDNGLESIDNNGNDNLIMASMSGDPKTVRLIAETFRQHRIDLNRRNCHNMNALMIAHKLGYFTCVKVLIEGGYAKTSITKDVLYGQRDTSLKHKRSFSQQHRKSNLPLIFSAYSDHLTNSFPPIKR